jgi:excisionase family DNA binding protein
MSKKSAKPSVMGTSFLARALGISENSARRLLDANAIPSHRDASGKRLVTREDVSAYLRRRGQAECA